jgi:tetratricopeptide (TPR) repeat protein
MKHQQNFGNRTFTRKHWAKISRLIRHKNYPTTKPKVVEPSVWSKIHRVVEIVYNVITRIAILSLIILFFFAFVREFQSDPLIIENFEIPTSLQEKGYSNRLFTQRILLEAENIRDQAALVTGLDTKQTQWATLDRDLITKESLDVSYASLNVGDYNIPALFAFLKTNFGKQDRKIYGIIQHSPETLLLTLSITNFRTVSYKHSEFDSLCSWAAEHIWACEDPATLGLHYIRTRRLFEAHQIVTHLENSQNLHSQEKSLYLKALIYQKEGNFDQVIGVSDSLMKLNPIHGAAYYMKAKACYSKLEEALHFASKGITQDGLDSLKKTGILCLKQIIRENLTDPIAETYVMSNVVPKYLRSNAYLLWAVFEAISSNETAVEPLLKNALKELQSPTSLYNAANTYLLIGLLSNAERYILMAIEMDPTEAIFWDTYAEIMVQKKDYARMYVGLKNVFKYTPGTQLNLSSYRTDERFRSVWKDKRFQALVELYEQHQKSNDNMEYYH